MTENSSLFELTRILVYYILSGKVQDTLYSEPCITNTLERSSRRMHSIKDN